MQSSVDNSAALQPETNNISFLFIKKSKFTASNSPKVHISRTLGAAILDFWKAGGCTFGILDFGLLDFQQLQIWNCVHDDSYFKYQSVALAFLPPLVGTWHLMQII